MPLLHIAPAALGAPWMWQHPVFLMGVRPKRPSPLSERNLYLP